MEQEDKWNSEIPFGFTVDPPSTEIIGGKALGHFS